MNPKNQGDTMNNKREVVTPGQAGIRAAREEDAVRSLDSQNPYAMAMLCTVSEMIDRLMEVEQSLIDGQFLAAAGGYLGIAKKASDAEVISTLMARHAEKPAVESARTYEAYNQAGRRVRCTVPE